MKRKTIFIVIELKVREFVAKVLFAYIACLRGYRIYLGSRESIIDLIKNKKIIGGIFFYKAGLQYKNCEDIDKKINAHVVLDEEVSPGHNLDHYPKMINSFPTTTRKFISKYFYINNKITKIVKKKFPIDKRKIISSGWPRVDIFTKKYSKIFNLDVKKIKKKYKKYYLFVSDFSYITKNYEQYAVEYLPWGVKEKEYKKYKKWLIGFARYNYEDFQNITSFLKDFAKNNKDIKILVRGHPADNIEEWKKTISRIKNLEFLEPKDDIQPWIMASSGVIHRGCTTSLQAYALKKPLAFLNLSKKKNYKDYLKKFTLKISSNIKNENDLKKWMGSNFNKRFTKIVDKELNLQKNKLSSENIVNVLDRIEVTKEEKIIVRDHEETNTLEYIQHIYNLFKRKVFLILVKSRIIKRNIDRFYLYPKLSSGINKNEALYYLKQIDKNLEKKINLKQHKNNLIVFEGKL